ncbi:AMP-dependent synthetase/ligase [Silvibacterium dinghuense]|uniref:Long-chain fatty acid--CoA ligase n=1 Tax=Silvibacterium dinghuense TaxID=1560006 RepID=A0A4Q1SDI2_9BACT|nr:long-chain fatty acid--CoA ligase [Silvibacterium dinghuense]RXS95284.1 long-chain fatty acid--CoA ligase [Silvibacterium dinghuense]GGH12143.1 AMP-dependent synthetase [Silvibacterium dinghuense]
MTNLKTLNDIFFLVTAGNRERVILEPVSGPGGNLRWTPISSGQLYQRVRKLASVLRDWGISRGDRIAILSENRWEWAVTDFAALAIGAIDVPIYPTLNAEQTAVLLADSGARVIFVSSRAQYEKVAAIRGTTAIERIVIMDSEGTPDGIPFASLMEGADKETARDAEFDRRAYDVQPNDIATLIYTSGTTGESKGVVLTHGNIASNLNESLAGFDIWTEDSCISFLPLSHITARHLDYAIYTKQATVAYCSAFEQLPAALAEVRPTVMVAVPRVYEKVRQEVERRAGLSPVKKRIFAWAVKTGTGHMEKIGRGEIPGAVSWKLAKKLVYSKVTDFFGGKVRYFISGGAPLGQDTAKWYASVGIRILEGYGLTETSPVLAINTPSAYRMGSVGKALPQVEYRFAEDGELLVKGPNVFSGYWKREPHDTENFDAEGWFRTGDIGNADADGFLYITDRKKELLKTSGGKLIAPQPIENRMKAHLLVGGAALVGDRHKFASALISPNFAALEVWAKEQGIAAATRRELVNDVQVVARYQEIVDEVNTGLSNYETIKRFRLVPTEWSLDSGELTPSLKLKRRVIAEKYAAEIVDLYADEATAHR